MQTDDTEIIYWNYNSEEDKCKYNSEILIGTCHIQQKPATKNLLFRKLA